MVPHNAFTRKRWSKSHNNDVGNNNYRGFHEQEWKDLQKKLERLNHRYTLQNPGDVDLTYKQLNKFVGNGPCVIVVVDGYIDPNLLGKGFFPTQNFRVFDQYSDTNDFGRMANDQLNKMKAQSGHYFLLSWTFTQEGTQPAFCSLA